MSIENMFGYGFSFILQVCQDVHYSLFGLNVFFLFIFKAIYVDSHNVHMLLSVISVECSDCAVWVLQRRVYSVVRYFWLYHISVVLFLVYSLLIEM